jgi:hypothetical protein
MNPYFNYPPGGNGFPNFFLQSGLGLGMFSASGGAINRLLGEFGLFTNTNIDQYGGQMVHLAGSLFGPGYGPPGATGALSNPWGQNFGPVNQHFSLWG